MLLLLALCPPAPGLQLPASGSLTSAGSLTVMAAVLTALIKQSLIKQVLSAPWRKQQIAEPPSYSKLLKRRSRLTVTAPFSCRSGRWTAVPEAAAPRPYAGVVLSEQYAASVPEVTRVLFGADSAFFASFLRRKRCSAVAVGRWSCDGRACERVVAYNNSASAIVQEHRAVERQRLTSPLEDGGLCVVDVRTETADVPFGDQFVVKLRYVLRATERGTHVRVSWELEWRPGRGSPVVRPVVHAGAAKGLRRNFEQLRELLDTHLKRTT